MRTQSSSGSSANAGDVTLLLGGGNTRGLRMWCIDTTIGSVRVFPALKLAGDGTPTYSSKQIVLSMEPNVNGSNQVTEGEGTFVAATVAGRRAYFFGEYLALKFEQVGAAATAIDVLGTEGMGAT